MKTSFMLNPLGNLEKVLKIPKYVLRSSGISRQSKGLIVRYSQKKELISFVFYCFENSSIAHSVGTTSPIQVGFSAKCTSPNEHLIK